MVFPNISTNIKDVSAGTTVTNTVTPLHVPFFFIKAEQGPVNTPVFCDYATAVDVFGAGTFNALKPYFNHQTLYAYTALQYQQVFLVRLADAAATPASLVLQAQVTQEPVVQYQTDASGNRILDNTGAPKPKLKADGLTVVTEPGISILWSTRPLAAGENIASILPTTTMVNGNNATTYPILAAQLNYVGAAGNRAGFSFYYTNATPTGTEQNIDSVMYRFAPAILSATNSGVSSTIGDQYNRTFNDVSLKSVALDPATNYNNAMAAVLANQYIQTDANGNVSELLPYTINVYSNNVKTIGALGLSVSPELSQSMDPFMINIVSGVDLENIPYNHIVIDPASKQTVNANVVLYASGGTDGDVTDVTYEANMLAQITAKAPYLQDMFRYPFTHVYDSGFTHATKLAMMQLYGLRDVKIEFSTQDMTATPNTAASDIAAGQAIMSQAQLYPESEIYATGACRASIYPQVALLADQSVYSGYVSCGLDRLIKRCTTDGGQYVKGRVKGRPQSEVKIYRSKSISWSPEGGDTLNAAWNAALNYVTYADMNTLYRPDIRSVYADQTSVLSDDVFVDWSVYLKAIARYVWTVYSGRSDNPQRFFGEMGAKVDEMANFAFSGALPTKTSVYQTALDNNLGYQVTMSIAVSGSVPFRVLNVIIPVSRTAATAS